MGRIFRLICPARHHTPQIATNVAHGYGALAQLGERLHGMQEVRGSIPLGSTKSSNKLMGYVRAVRDDPADRTLALHSFRHTFTTICRNAEPTIDWEMRERLLGHGGSETARTYGQAARVANVLKEIRRLDFSFLSSSK